VLKQTTVNWTFSS